MYRYEVCCDEYVEEYGFSTNYAVFDTFFTNKIITDTASLLGEYERINLDDGIDYAWRLRCYNADGDEIEIDSTTVWESER